MTAVGVQYDGEVKLLGSQAGWLLAGFLIALDATTLNGATTRQVAASLLDSKAEWDEEFGPQVPYPGDADVKESINDLIGSLADRANQGRFSNVVEAFSTFRIEGGDQRTGWLQPMEVRSFLIACRWASQIIGNPNAKANRLDSLYPFLNWPAGSSDLECLLGAARDANDKPMRIVVSLNRWP